MPMPASQRVEREVDPSAASELAWSGKPVEAPGPSGARRPAPPRHGDGGQAERRHAEGRGERGLCPRTPGTREGELGKEKRSGGPRKRLTVQESQGTTQHSEEQEPATRPRDERRRGRRT